MKLEEVTAVILCGGAGKRLEPFLPGIPKPMVSIGNTPFLELLLNYLKKQGIRNIILSLGFRAEIIIRHIQSSSENSEILFSKEADPLGTAGALKKAASMIHQFPVLVINGDTYYSVNLNNFLQFHKMKKGLATVVATKSEKRQDGAKIAVDNNCRIMSFEEKPDKGIIEYLSAGMYLFERTVLERIPNGVSSLEKETLPNLLKEEVFSFLVDTPQFDIGTPERLDMFRKVYLTTSHSSK